MTSRYHLGVADHLVLGISLATAALIGFKFRKCGSKEDYFLGGRKMSRFPVILSISVTSAVTVMGVSSELYKYGSQHLLHPVGTVTGMFITSYLLVPVYFQCQTSTVHEFLELRFGIYTRRTISSVFLLQSVMYVAVSLYAPALALSSIIDLPLEAAVFTVGIVVTFYCTLGGLKAILWTNAFQALLMFACVVAFYVAAIEDAGGFSAVYDRTCTGKRFQLFNFSLDLTVRYTFWNCFFQGVCAGISYGTSQTEVQKILSMESKDMAKKALHISTIPMFIFHTLANAAGLVLYALYYLCDPILNKMQTGLTKYDQLIPYYLVSRFNSVPGLTGLCMSGIFSGSLSAVSSSLNSLAAVSVIHFIKPSALGEQRDLWLARFLCAFFGTSCIALAYVISSVPGIAQLAHTVYSIQEGPMIATLLIAVLTTSPSDESVMAGLFVSVPVVAWVAVGSLLSGHSEPYLEISTDNCPVTNNFTAVFRESTVSWYESEGTTTPGDEAAKNTFIMYRMSYTWMPVIGCLFTVISVLVTTKLFECLGWNKEKKPFDRRCLSPVTRLWMKEATAVGNTTQLQTHLRLEKL